MASNSLEFQDVIDQADDPGGSGASIADDSDPGDDDNEPEDEPNSIISEDWKFVTNNTRIVVLPDPRLTSLLSQEDDQSSTGDSVQGEGLDDLEYDHEPGIALTQMVFASQSTMQTSMNESTCSLVASTTTASTATAASVAGSGPSRSRCFQCGVDYESDLQLAAELGKTLLERNKELEGNLRDHQSVIEDQSQEIEYLTKQTSTLREVNDSRVKIYEQLEVSISDLETTNKKLMEENLTDKVKIKSLCENIGKLENRCEELQRLLEEARAMLEKQQQLQKRRRERQKSSQSSRGFDVPDQIGSEPNSNRPTRPNSPKDLSDTESERTGSRTQEASSGYSSSSIESHLHRLDQSDSEMSSPDREKPPKSDVDPDLNLEDELLEASDQITKIDKLEVEERLHEMEKVVVSLQTENRRLQTIFASTTAPTETSSSSMQDSFRSVDDEVQDVQDVRRGKLCRKCLNVVDATPANLIGTAFQMMGETANQELQRVFWNWQKDELRLRSRNGWLDLWFSAVCFFALAISLCSSLTQLRCCT